MIRPFGIRKSTPFFTQALAELSRITALTAAILLTCSCQTAPSKSFDRISVGMSKAQVLEIVGGPLKTQRWQSKDRWTYDIPDSGEGPAIRELHFENGKVVYKGARITSTVTAADQDKMNDAANVSEKSRLGEIQTKRDKEFGVARVKRAAGDRQESYGPNSEPDALDIKIREAYSGPEDGKPKGRFEEVD